MTHEDFRERTSESWFDPAGLFLAVPAEGAAQEPRLLGFHWTKIHRDEEPADMPWLVAAFEQFPGGTTA